MPSCRHCGTRCLSKFCSLRCYHDIRLSTRKRTRCKQCRVVFQMKASDDRKFCSRPCTLKFFDGRVDKPCIECGKIFTSMRWEEKQSCSHECHLAWRHRGLDRKGRKTKCSHCGIIFKRSISGKQGPREYCSRECSSKGNMGTMHGWAWRRLKCSNCKHYFKRRAGNIRFKRLHQKLQFCSSVCVGKYFKGENHPCWKGGRSPANSKRIQKKTWRQTAAAVRLRDNDTCQICGLKWTKGMGTFHVDHIIPHIYAEDLWPGHADDVDNLLTVCTHDHGIKSKAERCLNRGNVLGWNYELRIIHYPMERVEAAFTYFRKLPSEPIKVPF